MTRRSRGRSWREDLTGKRYGRLTVIAFSHFGFSRHHAYWRCRCSCGKAKSIRADSLKDGSIRSCGCLNQERRLEAKRHGMGRNKNRSPVYSLFFRIRNVCRNPKARDYWRYGAKGIELRFENFQELLNCVGEKPGVEYRLERIDKYGHWEVGNLHWVELKPHRRRRRKAGMSTHSAAHLVNTPTMELTA